MPPEVGILDGAREGRHSGEQDTSQEKGAWAEPGLSQLRTGQKGTSIGTLRR